MNDRLKKILSGVVVFIVVCLVLYICYVNFRLEGKLADLTESITNCQLTASELGEGIRRQEQLLADLEQLSGQLESTIDELTATESNIDGYTGAIRGTIDDVTRTIELTLEGLEQEGISE